MCETCGEHATHLWVPGRRAADALRSRRRAGRTDMVDLSEQDVRVRQWWRAAYEDADGNKWSLCYGCAVAEGTHPERVTGASYEACRFFCELEPHGARNTRVRAARALGQALGRVERLSTRWRDSWRGGRSGPTASCPTRRARPRAPSTSSTATAGTATRPATQNTAASRSSARRARASSGASSNADLYAKTEAGSQAYLAAGYTVVEMWEHDLKKGETQRGANEAPQAAHATVSTMRLSG